MYLVLRFFGYVLLLLVLGLAVERLWWSVADSPTYSEQTAALPLLNDQTASGLVRVPTQGMEFRARVANLDRPDLEPVILLHGFPETSKMWDPLVDQLAAVGYRVLAFDMRGYSPGARPLEIESYRLSKLADDVVAIADKLHFGRFHLVGHDWGAAVGWELAGRHKERIASWSALSIPHFNAFRRALREDPEQKQRSSYMSLLRRPGIAEFLLSFNRASMLRDKLWNAHSPNLREHYTQVFLEKDALTGALNYYRALDPKDPYSVAPCTVPTLFIYGSKDPAVGAQAIAWNRDFVTGSLREVELDVGHWLMQEARDRTISEVLEHINAHPLGPES